MKKMIDEVWIIRERSDQKWDNRFERTAQTRWVVFRKSNLVDESFANNLTEDGKIDRPRTNHSRTMNDSISGESVIRERIDWRQKNSVNELLEHNELFLKDQRICW